MSSGFPAVDVRSAIADCLHASLSSILTPSIANIGPINTIGCFLLKHLTGINYLPVAGSVEVLCNAVPFGIEAHIENVDADKYYVWIEADHGEHGTELIDFGSRYWREWANEEGVLWVGGSPPPFIWSTPEQSFAQIAHYSPYHEITRIVHAGIGQAISSAGPDSSAAVWEAAINDTIDRMMDTPIGLDYLVEIGIAKPIDEDECCA